MNTKTEIGQQINLVDTLKNNKDGNKYGVGTCTDMDLEAGVWTHRKFEVKVEPQPFGLAVGYRVYVKDGEGTEVVGDTYRLAGVVEKVAIGSWRLHFTNPETGRTEASYTDRGTLAHYAHVVMAHFVHSVEYHQEQAREAEPVEVTLTEQEAEQVINNDPAPTGRHLQALVTVEVAERLAARVYIRLQKVEDAMRLNQPSTAMALISEAMDLLGEIADETTSTTTGQVKSLETSDAIAAQARKRVAKAIERVG